MARTFGTCRGCGEKLLRENYVRFGKIDTAAKERASGVSREHDGAQIYSWIHTPCPYCKEPRPLSRRWRGLLLVFGFLALFAVVIWAEFFA